MITAVRPLLQEAIREQRPVRLDYTSDYGEESGRVIEPHSIGEDSTLPIVWAWDRVLAERRSFRLDRIRAISLLDGETFQAPVGGIPEPPVALVRYHGSIAEYSSQVMRLLGICGCHGCERLGVRYRIAEPGSHITIARCVRPSSLSLMSEAESAAFLAEHEALQVVKAGVDRIRAEIDEVARYDYNYDGDAAHWSPEG